MTHSPLGSSQKGAGWALSLVLVASSANGLLCSAEPGDAQGMECCRDDAAHCNMPEKTEDCCRPDRASENPAALVSSSPSGSAKQVAGFELATLEYPAPIASTVAKTAPVPFARGFPDSLTNRPLIIPLLI